jgi:hypothetical protein
VSRFDCQPRQRTYSLYRRDHFEETPQDDAITLIIYCNQSIQLSGVQNQKGHVRRRMERCIAKEMPASSSDVSEGGDNLYLECLNCFAWLLIPEGVEVTWR